MTDDKKYFTIPNLGNYNVTLPKGYISGTRVTTPSGIYGVQDAGWIGYDGKWLKEEKKCECGAWITYGKECPPEFHAPTYCPIYEEPKENK